MDHSKQRVLFLCTGNSCRSQMAEGLLRQLAGDQYESLSAGSKPSGYVHPMAVEAMRELGIDISAQQSKSINDFLPPTGRPPDVVVSVCESAARECPTFPGPVERVPLPFDDPAHAKGSDEEKMAVFRRVRDEIKSAIAERFGPK
jgi:arsenate reductase